MTLYGYWRSGASWRVRSVLNLKGFTDEEIEYKYVHLVKDGGEQHSEAYKKLNPSELLPTLVIHAEGGDIVLSESLPICEYLEEAYPDRGQKLLPADALNRFKVRRLCETINAGTQPIQNLSVLQRIEKLAGAEAKIPWAVEVNKKGLATFEAFIADTKGTYCVGDQVTLADCFLIPQLYNADRFGLSLDDYPNIKAVRAALDVLPEFIKAHANSQGDAVL